MITLGVELVMVWGANLSTTGTVGFRLEGYRAMRL